MLDTVGGLQPVFLLLFFGYKLIEQTQMTSLNDMKFTRGFIPDPVPIGDDAWYQGPYPQHESAWKKLKYGLGRMWYHLF